MATTEELLAQLENNPEMYASDESQELVIDAETRTINIPASETLFGVKGDKNIERKYFRCPRIVGDNVDLSTHLIYIAYVYTESNSGSIFPTIGIQPYHCDDVEVDGDDITFSWKLSDHVFQSAGFIAFKMYAKEKEDSPYTVFNTAPAIGTVLYTIGDGEESVVSEYPDIINQLLAEMESVQEIATPEAMQNYVNAYLEKKPPSGVEIDKTFTQEGKAAEAKATGYELAKRIVAPEEDGTDGQVLSKDAEGNNVWKNAMTELKDGSVTTEKLSDDAVSREKIKAGAIAVNELDISYKKIYVEPYIVTEGLYLYNRRVDASTGENQSNIYCIELKAGKAYMVISEDYPRDENVTADRTKGDSTGMINSRFGVSSVKISDWKPGDNVSQRCDLADGAFVYSAIKSLNTKGNVILNDALASSDSNYYPSMFTAVTDLYLYFASYVPVGTQYLVTVPTGSYFLEVEEVPDFDEPTDYVTTTNNQFLEPFKFIRNYTDYYTGDKIKNNYLVTNVFASKRNRMLETALFRASRNISEYSVCAYIIGDSITYASSNAGLQNAWRKYITAKINIYQSSIAVSGTTMTYGYGTDWSSAINGASSSIEFTGVRGIKTAIKTTGKGSSKQQHAFSLGLMEFAIVALGTNDFGNNAKLGSVETFDDDGTFYGAAYQLFHFLHDEMKIPYVIFVAPFKRENWNVKNEAEVPYTIYDLVHALAEISLLENDMYVMDCTDRWYLNYDDPAIRDKSFIDYVHIKPYAHHMFTIDLALFIQNIVAVRGLRHYQPQFIIGDDEEKEMET